jgi:hypothetical protein
LVNAVVQTNLDTTGGIKLDNLSSLLHEPSDIALDVANKKMYITNYTSNTIVQANLDGTGGVSLGNLGGKLKTPRSIALALVASTTMAITSIGAQDGWVLESSENSNVGGSANSTSAAFNLGDDAKKKQYRGILSFNTGVIPDNATIIGVTLKVKQQAIVGGGNPVSIFQGFMVDIKNRAFGTALLQITDFQTAASSTYGPFSPALVGNVYSINLTAGKTNINKLATNSGLTQMRLRFKLDDNNNTIANYLTLYSGNATAIADRPQLVITYTVP